MTRTVQSCNATSVCRQLATSVAIGLIAATGTFAQSPDVIDPASNVLALERQVETAVLEANVTFLDQICAEDFTYSHGDGWTTGKPLLGIDQRSEWLASLQGRYVQREVDSQQIEMHGDVAITMGRVRARTGGSDEAQRAFSFWYIRVWAYRDNEWRYLSHRTVQGPNYEN